MLDAGYVMVCVCVWALGGQVYVCECVCIECAKGREVCR